MQKNLVIVYSRVSSGSQNLREQLDAANKALSVRKINQDEVIYLEDFNISATKNGINDRPAFSKLIRLIIEENVNTIFIYSRDRAYRNFYEGSEFNDLINKHNVEMIYTASDEIPFNRNSSIESFYAIFAQQEGKNIRKRTTDAIKRYPGQIIGYQRIDEKIKNGQTRANFKKDNERSRFIKPLFEEFCRIQSKEEFVKVLTKYGKKLNGHSTVVKMLQRPFYAAHCHTDLGYDQLDHVEAIIPLELFEKAQMILKKFIKEYDDEVTRAKEKIIFTPICGICSKEMKFKKSLEKPSYFVCSSNHKKVAIDLVALNKSIEETIIKETKQFTLTTYKDIFQVHLKGVLDNLTHEKQHKEHLLNKATLSLAAGSLLNHGPKSKNLQQQIQEKKEEIDAIDREIVALHSLKDEMETISNMVNPAVSNLTRPDLDTLIGLLIKEILIHQEYLEVSMYSLVSKKGVG